jgi:hypothetical protein
MLRTASSLPLYRAFDAGLRPGPFPGRAASLLPGLLAATRTGLTPAGDDELTNTKNHHGGYVTVLPPVLLGARKIEVNLTDYDLAASAMPWQIHHDAHTIPMRNYVI